MFTGTSILRCSSALEIDLWTCIGMLNYTANYYLRSIVPTVKDTPKNEVYLLII